MTAKGTERPLVTEVVLLAVLVLDELLILLVDRVVGQMHVLVGFVDLGGVRLTGESRKTLLEDIHSQRLITRD